MYNIFIHPYLSYCTHTKHPIKCYMKGNESHGWVYRHAILHIEQYRREQHDGNENVQKKIIDWFFLSYFFNTFLSIVLLLLICVLKGDEGYRQAGRHRKWRMWLCFTQSIILHTRVWGVDVFPNVFSCCCIKSFSA